MWKELILFVPGSKARKAILGFLEERGAKSVDFGGYQLGQPEDPLEVRIDEDLWSSYSADERRIIEEKVPGSEPVLFLYFKEATLIALLGEFATGRDWFVDEGKAGYLTLRTVRDLLAERDS